MRSLARLGRRCHRGILTALLIAVGGVLIPPSSADAQRQLVDPRSVSLTSSDLPRGFSVVEGETAFEPLRAGSEAEAIGVSFRTVLERARTLENLQSGPVRVGQIVARSDDPTRATFSLDAQREYNLRENGYEVGEATAECGGMLCLQRRDGPFVEYRIVAVKNDDTLVSTTSIGLPSAVHLEGAVALTKLSLSRYDEQVSSVLAARLAPQAADARSLNPAVQAVATATPTPVPPPAVPPTVTPGITPTVPPTAQPPKVKLPSQFDERFAQPWAELMNSTATTKSGERVSAFVRRVVEESDVEVGVGNLGANIGGEHRSVTRNDGDRAKIIESEITLNKEVMNESPRVIAAMLAHEITHANQPIRRSGKLTDCVEDEVEAYANQARVWIAFWGQTIPPGLTKWERAMNYVAEVWRDGGESGLRQVIREETGASTHSCIE